MLGVHTGPCTWQLLSAPSSSQVARTEGQQSQKLIAAAAAPRGGELKPRVFLAPGEFLPLLPTKITESDHCNLKSSLYVLTSVPTGGFSHCCSGAPRCSATVVQQHTGHWEAILVKMTLLRTPLQAGLLSPSTLWGCSPCSFQAGSPAHPRGSFREVRAAPLALAAHSSPDCTLRIKRAQPA